ncbi:MAG: hypothetical protein C0392_01100 [Syntrophus sp. (in: bacteria)]|nr:hypothetical protein [Syntrophus sp. (in: bacteria)]
MNTLIDKYFRVLGVSTHATHEEVKQAHRDLAKVWHPDRFPGDPRIQKKATENLAEINIAYEELIKYFQRDVRSHDSPDCPREDLPKEPPPAESYSEVESPASADKKDAASKKYIFATGMLIVCGLIILAGAIMIHMDFKKKKADLNNATPVLTPGPVLPAELVDKGLLLKKPSAPIKPSEKQGDASPATHLPPKKEFFNFGSSKDDVLASQGTPTQISGNRWNYGFSYIDFEKGKVVKWYSSTLDPLRVRMMPSRGHEGGKEFFTIGSSKDDVLASQGTPTQISGNRWNYGFSYIDFEKGRVVKWYSSDENPLQAEGEP